MELSFAADFDEDKYVFLEVPSEDILNQVLSGHLQLEFVSDGHAPIVACSQTETFELLEFDTSNTLLLHDGPTLLCRNFSTLELRRQPPPFLQLRNLLHGNPITEQEVRGAPISDPIMYDALLDSTQCSRAEFDSMLARLCAVLIDGAIKTPPPEIQMLITDEIIKYSMTLPEWRRIDVDSFLSTLSIPLIETPIMKDLVLAVLKLYSSESSAGEAILDESKVMWFIAESVLKRARNGMMRFEAFKNEMEGQLPPTLKLRRDSLFGLFVEQDDMIRYIDEESLPLELEDRLNALFAIHKRWDSKVMEPLFEFFVPRDLQFIDFIARYARFVDGYWMKR